ncbi:hypothetical protein [Niallia sp. MER TA 168]|uniref:hypothetical protein n=1 Tax=Niallia sp. MER TA 168 TaxID=2939568 RepID=UPI00203F76C8|nr:hypothetical protein [Niallia sp. MER TA 168]MCM3362040.1 hypothetical protein [Niallia sp. MER TA 168]
MKFKSFIVGVLTLTLLFSGITPSFAHVQTNDTQQSIINEIKEFNISEQPEDIEWNETVLENGEIEYSLYDYQIIEFLKENDQQEILNKLDQLETNDENAFSLQKAGVTKITKNSLGGYDVYLSKLVVQTLAVGGSAAIGFLVALIPGVGWSLAGVILGAMSAHLSTNIKHGKVFRFGKNFALKKVWSQ